METISRLLGALQSGLRNVGNNFLLPVAGAIIVIMIIWGGLQYVQGNAEGGKKTLTAAIIGLIIIALASLIIQEVARITM